MANDSILREETVWKEKKIKRLIRRIRSQIPENDSLSFQTRLKSISWDEVAFKSFTAKDCLEAWSQLSSKIRKFRLLDEILNDAVAWTEENLPDKTIITSSEKVESKNAKLIKAKAKHVSNDEDEIEIEEAKHVEQAEQDEIAKNSEKVEKPAKKTKIIKRGRKQEEVHIESSEENACELYLNKQGIFRSKSRAIFEQGKERWNTLSESEKKPWLLKSKKQELDKRNKLLSKSRPPTVAPSVYTYFAQKYTHEHPGIDGKERFSVIAQAWKKYDDASRTELTKEWADARREAYEGAREYLDSLDPTDREMEIKHYATIPTPAVRKRAASVSVKSNSENTTPKPAKRNRANSFVTTKIPPEEVVKEVDIEETHKQRPSKDALINRLKHRMRSSSDESNVDSEKEFYEMEKPVSPSKKAKASSKHYEEDIPKVISTSRRSMSPQFVDEEESEPALPVSKNLKSPSKENASKLNMFKRKTDKLKLKKTEKDALPVEDIRVGGESQIDTTGEEDADVESSYVFNINKQSAKSKPKKSGKKAVQEYTDDGQSARPKSKKTMKKALQEDTDDSGKPRRTMGETEFINHAGFTSSPKKRHVTKPSVEKIAEKGGSFNGNGPVIIEPKAPPESAELLFKLTSPNGEPWSEQPPKTRRKFTDALRALKKKYVAEYAEYLKAQPRHVLEEKANQ